MELLQVDKIKVFAALLKDVPKGCRDAVLPGHFLEDRTVICLAFEENIRQSYHDLSCLFRTLTLCLRGNHEVQEITSRMFNFFTCKVEAQFFSRLSYKQSSKCWGPSATEFLVLWNKFRWICCKKCVKVQQATILYDYSQTITIFFTWRIIVLYLPCFVVRHVTTC